MNQDSAINAEVAAVRRFNRFYTRQIGLLQEQLLKSPFSLSQARVIYELAQQEETSAAELCRRLDIDAGYLSRMLNGFQRHGLLEKRPSPTDGRQSMLRLSQAGTEAFHDLNARQQEDIVNLLVPLAKERRRDLVDAMHTIEDTLASAEKETPSIVIRAPRPGDMGWVIYRHGALYAQEYGWSERFEALVADIVNQFMQSFDPQKERCWIAEVNGEKVGSIFLVKKTDEIAKLRLLLLEPSARGLGIGSRLVDECIAFARQVGYRKMTLWTNNNLTAARHIYKRKGFLLVKTEPNDSFGENLVGETWDLDLT